MINRDPAAKQNQRHRKPCAKQTARDDLGHFNLISLHLPAVITTFFSAVCRISRRSAGNQLTCSASCMFSGIQQICSASRRASCRFARIGRTRSRGGTRFLTFPPYTLSRKLCVCIAWYCASVTTATYSSRLPIFFTFKNFFSTSREISVSTVLFFHSFFSFASSSMMSAYRAAPPFFQMIFISTSSDSEICCAIQSSLYQHSLVVVMITQCSQKCNMKIFKKRKKHLTVQLLYGL